MRGRECVESPTHTYIFCKISHLEVLMDLLDCRGHVPPLAPAHLHLCVTGCVIYVYVCVYVCVCVPF